MTFFDPIKNTEIHIPFVLSIQNSLELVGVNQSTYRGFAISYQKDGVSGVIDFRFMI